MQLTLYDIRKNKLGWTQKQFASAIGISVKAYRDKEKGKYPFDQDEMFLISKIVGEPMDKIFSPRSHQNGAN